MCTSCAADMFLNAALLSEHAALDPSDALPRQLGHHCISFFMKGIAVVPHHFHSRPKAAQFGAPNSRFGFSYSDLRKVHKKPDIQQTVPGPFLTAQLGFLPTRAAAWNKPVSFNANTLCQQMTGTYGSWEPRFDTLLTRSNNKNPHFSEGGGFKLTPYKWQLKVAPPVSYNRARAAVLQEEAEEVATEAHVHATTGVSGFLGVLQNKRSVQYQSAPRQPRTGAPTPRALKPWRAMLSNEDDAAMSTLDEMACQAARRRDGRATGARGRAASAATVGVDGPRLLHEEPWRAAFACV